MNTSGSTKLEHEYRPKSKGISATKATNTVKTTATKTVQRGRSKLEAALKMYAELNRNKRRSKGSITSRIIPAKGVNKQGVPKSGANVAVNSGDKPSKGTQSQRTQLAQHSQLLRETRRESLLKLSQGPRLARLAPRKESVCPITRSVASLEMNVPTGKRERESSVSTLGSDDERVKDRVSVDRTNSQLLKAQRAKTTVAKTTVATPVIKRSLTPQVDKQYAETHRIAGTDLCVSMISKSLVSDIVSVFGTLGVDKMPVDSLLQHLCADSTKPWSAYQGGKPIGARQLNRVLTKELGVHSYDIRVGANGGANGSANNSVKGSKIVKGLHRRVFELLQVSLNAGLSTPRHSTQLMAHKRGFEPAVR